MSGRRASNALPVCSCTANRTAIGSFLPCREGYFDASTVNQEPLRRYTAPKRVVVFGVLKREDCRQPGLDEWPSASTTKPSSMVTWPATSVVDHPSNPRTGHPIFIDDSPICCFKH